MLVVVEVVIKKSDKYPENYDAVMDNKRQYRLGPLATVISTKHKDEESKERYIARHKPNQDWKDYMTASFTLWNKPAVEASINDISKKLPNLTVKVK